MLKKLLLSALILTTASAFAAPLKIGWATADASTDKPVHLQGLTRKRVSLGLRDPITITALVIDNGEDFVVFNAWDTSCVFGTMAKRVRAGVARKLPGFPVEKIVFNAIHTHTGPSTGPGYDDGSSLADTPVYRCWRRRSPSRS